MNDEIVGNKATIDWRDLPDAVGKTHWDYEREKETGIVAPIRTIPERETVSITAIPKNTKMVDAIDSIGNPITVEVGNNSNFAIGDNIQVGPHASGYPDIRMLLSGVPRDKRRNLEVGQAEPTGNPV